MERHVTPVELQRHLDQQAPLLLFDVRRPEDVEADPRRIPAAGWRDPAQAAAWGPTLPAAAEIVVYCVRGRSVSNSVLDQLLGLGLKARLLEGGIEAWKQTGGALEAHGP